MEGEGEGRGKERGIERLSEGRNGVRKRMPR